MPRKREKPEWFTSDPKKLAEEIEEGIAGHDYDDYTSDHIFYNGEMRMVAKALRQLKE